MVPDLAPYRGQNWPPKGARIGPLLLPFITIKKNYYYLLDIISFIVLYSFIVPKGTKKLFCSTRDQLYLAAYSCYFCFSFVKLSKKGRETR